MTRWPLQELHPDACRALVEGAPAILYIDRPVELSTNLYSMRTPPTSRSG